MTALLRQEGGGVTGFSAQSASFSVDAIAKRLGYKDFEMTAAERTQRYMQVKGLVAGGKDLVLACKVAGISRASFDRWVVRFEAGGRDGLEDLPRSGRPPLVELVEEERDYLRTVYLKSNLNAEAGSMTFAARWAAKNAESPLRDVTREAILKERASKHILPVEVRRACRASMAEVARYRQGSKAGLNDGIFIPGWLRLDDVGNPIAPGFRQVWDDGTTNFGLWVDWAQGGDACSDRYGVRVGRYQLLACIDCATDMCVGYNVVVRANDAYNAADVCGSLFRLWKLQGYAPDECVMEGGSWQAGRSKEFLEASGVRLVSAKGRPNQKLVESWFNRLWKAMSVVFPKRSNVGRFRGEMAEGNKNWLKCREGVKDPRDYFPSMPEFLDGLDRCIAFLNAEVVESRTYGKKWVPADVYAAQKVKGHEVPMGVRRFGLPVREERKIWKRGVITVAAMSPVGSTHQYVFTDDRMFRFLRAPVIISFDPYEIEKGAIVELRENWKDHKKGELIAEAAICVSRVPEVIKVGDGWICQMRDVRHEAGDVKKRSRKLIAMQVAAHDKDGVKARYAKQEHRPGEVAQGFSVGKVKAAIPEYVEPEPVPTDEEWAAMDEGIGVLA